MTGTCIAVATTSKAGWRESGGGVACHATCTTGRGLADINRSRGGVADLFDGFTP